ncbi:FxsA family protein [Litoribacterium kuwaitense]|uniref:FxsA family protein n=1 Tax=Litoribacterium kuwaitense TaxID=1398745 RepID=UPI001FE400EB|nr:FxsA family protein [Litoribacterium kuwaitense]
MKKGLLLFIIVPLLETILFILLGRVIGFWPTVIGILLTGVIGAWLLKKEGSKVLEAIRMKTNQGIPPTEELLDGACIVVGGIFLLTPGFITDTVGFVLLLPPLRRGPKQLIKKLISYIALQRNFIFFRRF